MLTTCCGIIVSHGEVSLASPWRVFQRTLFPSNLDGIKDTKMISASASVVILAIAVQFINTCEMPNILLIARLCLRAARWPLNHARRNYARNTFQVWQARTARQT